MKIAAVFVAALLAAVPFTSHAQSKPDPADTGGHRAQHDCSKARDPAACAARREALRAAQQACRESKGAERGACMSRHLCAKSEDPAACNARAAERRKAREQARQACKGKEGEPLRACAREQRRKMRGERQ